jgi:hypothetical protein
MEDASMTSENVSGSEAVEPTKGVSAKAVDVQLIDELVGRAQAEGLQLTGEGGLLQQLTKRLLAMPRQLLEAVDAPLDGVAVL